MKDLPDIKVLQRGINFSAHNAGSMFGPPKEALDHFVFDLNSLESDSKTLKRFRYLAFLLLFFIPPVGAIMLLVAFCINNSKKKKMQNRINEVVDRHSPTILKYFSIEQTRNGYYSVRGSSAELTLKNIMVPVVIPNQKPFMINIKDIPKLDEMFTPPPVPIDQGINSQSASNTQPQTYQSIPPSVNVQNQSVPFQMTNPLNYNQNPPINQGVHSSQNIFMAPCSPFGIVPLQSTQSIPGLVPPLYYISPTLIPQPTDHTNAQLVMNTHPEVRVLTYDSQLVKQSLYHNKLTSNSNLLWGSIPTIELTPLAPALEVKYISKTPSASQIAGLDTSTITVSKPIPSAETKSEKSQNSYTIGHFPSVV